jgi:ClpP class serine protease
MVDAMNILWLIFLLYTLVLPWYNRNRVDQRRVQRIRAMEQKRGSRVITMIHRQEAFSLLGFPVARYINIEDSEHILRAVRFTPDNMPIDLVLHTPGGLVLATEQIATALRRHPARVTVFVPHYAMSGGTMLALAADEIFMDEGAVLGPVDPQLGQFPAASVLRVAKEKPIAEMDDETLIMADLARKAIDQVQQFVTFLLRDKMDAEKAKALASELSEGRWTHDYPIFYDQLKAYGLPVREGLPREVYELMDLFPQPAGRRPSVLYIPVPYHGARVRDESFRKP